MTEVPDNILAKVQKLIERAEHAGTNEAERDACLQMADKFMTQHAIDEAMLATLKPNARTEPVFVEIDFVQYNHPRIDEYSTLLQSIAKTARCRVAIMPYQGKAMLVGYADDIAYAQMVWLSVYMQFVAKIDPTWDTAKTEDANVKALKDAGWKWERIALAGGFDWPDGGKLIRAYRRECKRLGEEARNHTQRHAAYRASFITAYVRAVDSRLRRMRVSSQETVAATSGAELALRDRGSVVDEKLWEMFPHLRPATDEERERWAEKARKEKEAEAERLAAMTPAQRRQHDREQAKQERENERWWNNYWKQQERLHDSQGADNGRVAGEQVDLSGGRNNVGGRSSRPSLEG